MDLKRLALALAACQVLAAASAPAAAGALLKIEDFRLKIGEEQPPSIFNPQSSVFHFPSHHILASFPCDPTVPLPPSFPAAALDVQPTISGPHPSLRYPPSLVMAGVTGEVRLQYDVDSTGMVDPCSIRILAAKRPELAASARDFVAALHFTPGIKDGATVRTRVEQSIRFLKTNGDRGKHHLF